MFLQPPRGVLRRPEGSRALVLGGLNLLVEGAPHVAHSRREI